MVELNVYQDNKQTSEFYKKWYARASYKQQIDLNGLARLLKTHNTNWSEGALVGILKDMVKEVREQTLNGDPKTGQMKPTGNAVKNIKLLAQATGEYTRAELNKDAVLGWTDLAQKMIDDAKQPEP